MQSMPATNLASYQVAAAAAPSGVQYNAKMGASVGAYGGSGGGGMGLSNSAINAPIMGKMLRKDGRAINLGPKAPAYDYRQGNDGELLVAVKPQPKSKADDRPISLDEKKQEESSQSANEAQSQKLSAELKAWVDGTTGDTATIKVKVTFASVKDIALVKLKGWKLESRKAGTSEVFATVTRDALLKLLKFRSVLTVTKA
jgi:hypothetical protein